MWLYVHIYSQLKPIFQADIDSELFLFSLKYRCKATPLPKALRVWEKCWVSNEGLFIWFQDWTKDWTDKHEDPLEIPPGFMYSKSLTAKWFMSNMMESLFSKKGVSLIIWRFLVFLIERTKRIYIYIFIHMICLRDVCRNIYVEQSLLSLYQSHQYQMVSKVFEKNWLATNLIEHKIGEEPYDHFMFWSINGPTFKKSLLTLLDSNFFNPSRV